MAKAHMLDVRTIIPRERHRQIFDILRGLDPGDSLTITNDHDPRPLYYQLQAEHPDQFSWIYEENGPDIWRVEIARPAS